MRSLLRPVLWWLDEIAESRRNDDPGDVWLLAIVGVCGAWIVVGSALLVGFAVCGLHYLATTGQWLALAFWVGVPLLFAAAGWVVRLATDPAYDRDRSRR